MRIRIPLLTTILVSLGLTAGALTALASSHREALRISNYPAWDNTDLYAFTSPDDASSVTFVSNWWPFAEPSGGPNFYQWDDDAWYYIKIDNVGDAKDHIVYEFKFDTEIQNPNTFLYNTGPITSLDDPDWNIRQYYRVTRYVNGRGTVIGRHIPVAPNRVGDASTPNYDALAGQAVKTLSDGSRVFVGERDDPFFVDLGGTFDLLTIRDVPGNHGLGVDGLGGFNVLTIALQVPKNLLTKDGRAPGKTNSIIGVYSTTEIRGGEGDHHDHHGDDDAVSPSIDIESDHDGRGRDVKLTERTQVSRLGSPLVNEVVIPLKDKDRWNGSDPRKDAQFGSYVTNPGLPGLLNLIYGVDVPSGPRNDLVAVFLTGIPGLTQPANVRPSEFLRLNMAIDPSGSPSRLGVLGGDLAGFPNGRRLEDDVVDIELRAVAGVLVDGFNISPNNVLGDGVDRNDLDFLSTFPYVATPHNGLSHDHHRTEPAHAAAIGKAGATGIALPPQDDAVAGETPALRMAGANPAGRHDLEFTLDRAAKVSLKVYDLQGRQVRTLVDRDAGAGTFRASWDGRDESGRAVGKGVFFARYTMDGTVVNIRKLVLE